MSSLKDSDLKNYGERHVLYILMNTAGFNGKAQLNS